jgi:hypothetical protein
VAEVSSPVTVIVADVEMRGRFRKMRYDSGHTALLLVDITESPEYIERQRKLDPHYVPDIEPGQETLSVNLAKYFPGLPDGHVWVKDYGTWAGTADSLAETGLLAKRGTPYKYGPYDAQAQMMEVLF